MNPYQNVDPARRLIAGGICDFVQYLATLDNPIVVGKQYPRNRLMKAFNDWAASRSFFTQDADLTLWANACQKGFMRKNQ